MNFLINIVLFWVAFFLGGLYFSLIILPVFYGIPRCLIWILRGQVKARALLVYISSPLFWLVTATILSWVMVTYFPRVVLYLDNSSGIFFGSWAGVIMGFIYTLSASGRQSLSDDFARIKARFIKRRSYADPAQELMYLAVTFPREMQIAHAYSECLKELPGPLRPISKLPCAPEIIRKAIERLNLHTENDEYKFGYESALIALDGFIPDEEVPLNAEENRLKWMMILSAERKAKGSEE